MAYKNYNKQILSNFLVSKFNIKNTNDLPSIKSFEISSTNKNTRYLFFLAATTLLLTAKYPEKIIKKTRNKGQAGMSSTNIQLKCSLTNQREIFSFLFNLIYLTYAEIPGFKGFSPETLDNQTGVFNLNFLPYFPEISRRVSRNELPLRNKQINYTIKVVFSSKNKNKNMFVLKALQFPINL
jgi:ribosomal protein L5